MTKDVSGCLQCRATMDKAAADTREGFRGARELPCLLRGAWPGAMCLNSEETVRRLSEAPVRLREPGSDGPELGRPAPHYARGPAEGTGCVEKEPQRAGILRGYRAPGAGRAGTRDPREPRGLRGRQGEPATDAQDEGSRKAHGKKPAPRSAVSRCVKTQGGDAREKVKPRGGRAS